jgi:serine/threonine protein kinase
MSSSSQLPANLPQDDTAYRIQRLRSMQPQDPLPETEHPQIDACLTDQPAWLVPRNSPEPEEGVIDIVRRDNPKQAYRILPSREKKNLDHHAPGWGFVEFGIVLRRLAEGVYQMPHPDTVEYVAIKRLNRKVVDHSLTQGKRENPYKEIYRMQVLGDNIHVLGCIEALQDENYLYIIMPYCEQESLVEWIPWKQGFPEERARQVFQQVLENIIYLRQHGVCHRDLSPDNCMIYKERVVFTDLAMSFRIPLATSFVTPLGGFGKPAYLPPEVYYNLPFDAFGCDLWSSVVILFNLLTGEILYREPIPSDINFRYFILARGISQTPANERTVEVLMGLEGAEQTALWKIASRCLHLSPEVLEILDQVLRVAMQERWTTDEISASAFMNHSV